ncbi:MAG: heavy metal translocating P-type ATPase [Rhizobiaceae bacterium]
MSCCAPGIEAAAEIGRPASREEIALASRDLGDGLRQTDLAVPDMHCGACMRAIESALTQLPGVSNARANLTARRVTIKWRRDSQADFIPALSSIGYKAHLYQPSDADSDPELARLIRAVAVAGFVSMNIMMLSVSVWSGADDETRQAFHWMSAALALPALLYSGGIFYRSAWQALRHGRTNMDVPISIGISLAYGLSLYDTLHLGHHAYFDAATSLIFFLLIGRTLDHVMRQRARVAVRSLVRLAPRGATIERADGSRDFVALSEIEPGMIVLLAVGDRLPVDGRIVQGVSSLDCSIASGESLPVSIGPGSTAQAGALNLAGPIKLEATARAQDSFLAEITRLMEAAEGGRARYRRVADRASALYSPVVHLAAFLTFIGWMAASGDWHRAASIAIAVLIITCPCALGLAVPIVQVVAARRLFDAGIMMKDGSAIERLAEIDSVAFDKTGTLTTGSPRVLTQGIAPDVLALAAELASHSRHPVSRAIASAAPSQPTAGITDIVEHAGLGVEATIGGAAYRLGRADWASGLAHAESGPILARDGEILAAFNVSETLRTGAGAAVKQLRDKQLSVRILSGDRPGAVARVARALGMSDHAAGLMPADKVGHLAAMAASGHRVLMVGDGLNDAPALAAAHVSMAPATAADVGRNAADFVFLRDSLAAVPLAVDISQRASRLVKQNFGIAVVYNLLAMPVAIAGYVTPLLAALAMSLSSVIVVANALRLKAAHAQEPSVWRQSAGAVAASAK